MVETFLSIIGYGRRREWSICIFQSAGHIFFFSKTVAGSSETAFSIPYSEEQKKHLWYAYYLQKDYHQKNNSYASELSKLGINEIIFTIDGKENKLWMEATSRQFMVYISAGEDIYTLNDEGLVQLSKKNLK